MNLIDVASWAAIARSAVVIYDGRYGSALASLFLALFLVSLAPHGDRPGRGGNVGRPPGFCP